MRRNIYMDKETEQAYQELRPYLSLSLLVREILLEAHISLHPGRIVRDTPDLPEIPLHYTFPEPVCVLDETTVLYNPTIADMDRLQATSVRLEWYDENSETWRRSE